MRVIVGNMRIDWGYIQDWVAAKELDLSYYIGATILVTICAHYSKLIQVP